MEPSRLGLILDSSIFVSAVRRGRSILQILEQVKATCGEVDLGLSVVTVAELMHGAYRTKTDVTRQRQLAFIDRLCADVPVYPMTLEIARLVGRVEGEQAAKGITIAFEDLVIGITGLHLGFGVATANVKHFRMIPGLDVVEF